jgi:hypothetical protein
MKNVLRNRKTYFIFFLISTSYCKAQLLINISPPSNKQFSQSEIWNLVINNIQPFSEVIYLEAELSYNTSGIILKGKSIAFEIPSGATIINPNSANNINYEYPNPKFFNSNKSVILPNGSYNLCISIKRLSDNLEIGKNCIEFNNQTDSISSDTINKKYQNKKSAKKHYKFYGKSELLGNCQTQQNVNSNIPPNYLWWSINPSISIYDVPFSVQTIVSTYNTNSAPSLVTLNFNFDSKQYKNILKSKAISKLNEIEQNKKFNNSKSINLYNELSTIKKTLNNPTAINDLKKIDELEKIENQLTDSLKSIDIDKYDSLKNQVNNYAEVSQKKIGYDRLQQKESQLEDQVKRNYLEKYYNKYSTKTDSLAQLKNIDISKVSNNTIDSLFNGYNLKIEKANSDLTQEVNKVNNYSKYDYSKLNNPEELEKKLSELGLLTKLDKYLYSIKNFTLGTSYPYYNDLTLSNIIINGINVEIQPKKVYLAFTKGTIQKPLYLSNIPSNNSEIQLTSGAFGYGYKNSNHVYFYLLDFKNTSNNSDTLYYQHKPESNQILSSDFKLNIYKNLINLEGVIAGSQSINGIKDSFQEKIYVDSNKYSGFDDPNKWITNILTQKCSNLYASVDYAYKIRIISSLFHNNTKFEIGVKRIGPNFISLGLPYLQNNLISYEAKVTQSMFKRKLNVTINLIQNHENIGEYDLLPSLMTNIGFNISLNIPKKPYVRLNYNPVFLKNDSMSYNLRILSVLAGHSYKIMNVMNSSNLSFMKQQSISDGANSSFQSYMIGYNHLLNYKASNSISLSLSYVSAKYQDTSNSMYNIGISTTYRLFKKIQNVAGINYLSSISKQKFGFFYEIRYKLSKSLTFNIRAERNRIENYLVTENGNLTYKDFVIKTSINMIW